MLELFSGSKIMSKIFSEFGFETLTIDNNKDLNPDLCINILDLDSSNIGKFDVIWASPPCTTFSVSSIWAHWTGVYKPKTEKCKNNIKLVEKTLEIISVINPKYWFIENPIGVLRKLDIMKPYNKYRKKVTYCRYGENRMKPTDIWTNCPIKFRKPCSNNDGCHPRTPRGCKTVGTESMGGNYERSIIPKELCVEVASYCKHLLCGGKSVYRGVEELF